ncbi:MAG: ABC transporter transmembrane domain-containing protein, partial [Phycicoccus sp.]
RSPEARRPLASLAAIGVAQGAASIGLAFALTALVVAVVSDDDRTGPALTLAALFAVRAGLGWAAERAAAVAGAEVSAAVREALVVRWLHLPAERRPDPDRAAALTAQGAASVEPYAARFLPALVAAVVVPVLAVLALIRVDLVSALVVVATLPLLPVFAALIGKQTAAETERRWRALESLGGHFLDVMRGLPTLVAYGRAERQVGVVAEVSGRHRRATMRTLRTAFLSSAVLELLASISVAIVAVTVGIRLTHGSMTLEAGLLAILLAPEAYWPARRVGAEFHAAADGAEALSGILPELERPDDAPPHRHAAVSPRARRPAVAPGCAPTPPGADRARTAGPVARDPARPTRSTTPPGYPGVRLVDVSYSYPGSESSVLQRFSMDVGRGLPVLTG